MKLIPPLIIKIRSKKQTIKGKQKQKSRKVEKEYNYGHRF
jgi:hypothetical protein